MPVKAFVLAQTEPGKTREVVGKLPKPAYITMGRWDNVTLVTGETPKMLADQVIDQIRKQDGIRRTETLPILTASVKPTQPAYNIKALLFLNAEAPKTNSVFGNLANLPEATEVYTVAGRYDIIAILGFNAWDEFAGRICNRIRAIEGITSTETALIVG